MGKGTSSLNIVKSLGFMLAPREDDNKTFGWHPKPNTHVRVGLPMPSHTVKDNFSLVLGLGAPKLGFDFGKVEGSHFQRSRGYAKLLTHDKTARLAGEA
jgi:hypothetical protein